MDGETDIQSSELIEHLHCSALAFNSLGSGRKQGWINLTRQDGQVGTTISVVHQTALEKTEGDLPTASFDFFWDLINLCLEI